MAWRTEKSRRWNNDARDQRIFMIMAVMEVESVMIKDEAAVDDGNEVQLKLEESTRPGCCHWQ